MENAEGRGVGGVTIRDPNSPPDPISPDSNLPPRPPLPDPSPRPQSPDPHLFLTHPPHYTLLRQIVFVSSCLRVKLSSRQVCSRHIFRFKLSCSDTLDLIALRFSTSVASFYRFCACLVAAT